jgi:hypothetical protein
MLWHHDRTLFIKPEQGALYRRKRRTPFRAGSPGERFSFAGSLSKKGFGACFGLGPCDLVSRHQRSELMLDGHCRRKLYPSSEPVCAH